MVTNGPNVSLGLMRLARRSGVHWRECVPQGLTTVPTSQRGSATRLQPAAAGAPERPLTFACPVGAATACSWPSASSAGNGQDALRSIVAKARLDLPSLEAGLVDRGVADSAAAPGIGRRRADRSLAHCLYNSSSL